MSEKRVRTDLWIEDGAIRIRAYISDFDSESGNDWKKSFYELWRYQMTWDFAHEIKVHEVHDGDVCVSMLIKKSFKKNVLDTMEHLGYRNIEVDKEHVGVIELYDIDAPEAEDMFTVIAE